MDELAQGIADLARVEHRAVDELARRDDVLQAATLESPAHRDRGEHPGIGPHENGLLHSTVPWLLSLPTFSQGRPPGTVCYVTPGISPVIVRIPSFRPDVRGLDERPPL